ncbi:unnamed protein product [Bursaphelenchus okinawaensis]|uniref:GDP-fucose protein O-fucosyltransferase 1 n=1 Tax=Bursaphelenchus okinawaensis TaxID=465554 RepID=A0A811LMB2_9BILA|nr:unnamed protein product [Bursaphelenchus okinawaensis]CAG9124271.1 unnamed protein product [Bursaphelenchus okinawaensis]
MGRFGNQLDQLLGSIHFAIRLNRTLVLPPFLEYPYGFVKVEPKPFENIFKIEPFQDVLPVISMEEFMDDIAPDIWPNSKRYVFCHRPRTSPIAPNSPAGCHSKEGNPFGVFWDHFGVDFVEDKYFGDIGLALDDRNVEKWIKFSEKYPVLAFTSPPAGFPSPSQYHQYQKYLEWNDDILAEAENFIKLHLSRPFVAVHLRNNVDWEQACTHVNPNHHFFASAQCTGEDFEVTVPSKEICFPNRNTVIASIKEVVDDVGAKSIFVFSDKDHMISELYKEFGRKVAVRKLAQPDPYVSLAIAGLSDHFIANCMSTFSAITVRQRRYQCESPKSTSFFGLNLTKPIKNLEL